ncbi:Hypothetical protein PBC10988_38610 [Planctomycetales bacterium 10988]|nr:Hypothetical protein PBC10988_38610 [Planctomycetales bacterium 10988]
MTKRLEELIRLFFSDPKELGTFSHVQSTEVPEPYRHLLAHEHHMTVTVEAFHRSLVDVKVLEKNVSENHYARRILLVRQDNQEVVQWGIMRIDLSQVAEEVAERIRAEETPLGRILIEHNVLRSIHLLNLWQVEPGPELNEWFENCPNPVYGRTAIIECNHQPAIELIEIVTPGSTVLNL